jgi:hypothetical protein
VTAIGGWSFQTAGSPRQHLSWRALTDPGDALQSLFVNGYYPFFPVFAFFAVGIVIGRLDLGRRAVAASLAVGGAVVGFGTMAFSEALLAMTGSTVDTPADGSWSWSRLLDYGGHSEMPAWVVSATGTSIMVLGLCLLLLGQSSGPTAQASPGSGRVGVWTSPVVTLGMMSLSFYAFQIVTSRLFPSPFFTSLEREWFNVAVLYGGFAVFALGWRRWVGTGPLEALLRIGSRRRQPDRGGPGSPTLADSVAAQARAEHEVEHRAEHEFEHRVEPGTTSLR